ncbi:DUF87 domain-containing protein [Candidatus Collierbacteria bacterium]|nr:DUF87 domain-containing protein [Candidatus Collierbacteria bacterium]
MSGTNARSILEIRAAKDAEYSMANFVNLLASLSNSLSNTFLVRFFGNLETITLELASLDQTIFFIVTCPSRLESVVKSQIAAQYPDAVITPMTDYLAPWLSHGQVSLTQLTIRAPYYLPLNTVKDASPDLLASPLGVLSKLPPQQAAVVQICLTATPGDWAGAARKIIELGIGTPEKPISHPQKALIEQKIVTGAFQADIRLATIATDQKLASILLDQLAASFGVYSLSEANRLAPKTLKPKSEKRLSQVMVDRSSHHTPRFQYLNFLEIASLYHFPSKALSGIRNIAWGKTLKGEPPANLPIAEGLTPEQKSQVNYFARTEYKNRVAIFGIKNGNDRRRHVYILGKSGTGKSTLIANMAIADIRNRAGVAVVDPHGDLSEILLDFIPSYRINDVAYLDPSQKEFSFRINPLFVKNPENKDLVASGIVSIFSKLYGNSWGPRLEYILRNTLLTLVNKPGTTLLDVPKLLTNFSFREKLVAELSDQVLVNFWKDEYNNYTEKFQSEAIAPVLNKVGQFITSPTIRNIVGHPNSTIDLEDCINQGKIIILNLSQGRIGEDNAALLGAMIITQIQMAAMNRINVPEEDRRDFFLYVDEFQNFATTSFVKILSEARKFRLNLILANQYTAQLPEEIQKAIFGNAGTMVSFVVGADDANRLIAELGNTYTQDDLVNLAKYQIITKLTVDGSTSTPFPAYTLPLPFSRNQNRQKVIRASRERFYKKNPTP